MERLTALAARRVTAAVAEPSPKICVAISSTGESSPFSIALSTRSKTALWAVVQVRCRLRRVDWRVQVLQSKTNVVANSRLDVSNSVPRPGLRGGPA